MSARPEPSQISPQLAAARRAKAAVEARDSLLTFMRLTMPDPESPEDATKSRYEETPVARLLCQIMEQVFARNMKRVGVSIGPQMGKALAVDTPIPTPAGWSQIGDLLPGDFVFDEKGAPTRVVAVTPVWRGRPVFVLGTDDGDRVVADAEHDWLVRFSKSYPRYSRRTTAKIAARKGLRNVKTICGGALDLPARDFPIDPYVLGVWLGDGSKDTGYITAVGDDKAFLMQKIAARGYAVRENKRPDLFLIEGLGPKLRNAHGLLFNKHMPAEYLRGSIAQRLDLLHGLVDTDGHVDKAGAVEFCNTNRAIAEAAQELVRSLGFKCAMQEARAMLDGVDCGPKYRVRFFMPNAASIPRKAARCKEVLRKPERYLTIKAEAERDTVCIEVEAASHMFLCGRSMVPTFNSQITSRGGPAWMIGKDPYLNLILGTYNQDFANEFGDNVREILGSAPARQVFGSGILRVGGKAKDLLITEKGGRAAFVGRGGSGTGKPADIFIVDDPLKDDAEAQSNTTREHVWNWFNKVAMTRCHKDSAIIIVHTRWHQDDLIGRLMDPEHPERDKRFKGIAKRWQHYNIPAIIDDPKLAKAMGLTLEPPTDPFVVSMFGSKPMSSIWPSRKSLEFFAEAKQLDPSGFSALNMGNPTPEDGDYFKADWLSTYERDELPTNLMKYGASDHSLTENKKNDPSVIGCVGVDEENTLWVLPDVAWQRMKTDKIVDELISQMRIHKPAAWWLEEENISKAFGPFLIARMHEERVYCVLDGNRPAGDKATRARAIQGRMAMKTVKFPNFAPWWPAARREILNFPNGAHDDFVDFLAHIGLGLLKQYTPRAKRVEDNVSRVGSIEWTLRSAALRARKEKIASGAKGW